MEAVLFKVYLDEYGDNLVVIVDYINVLSDCMLLRESTSLAPSFLVDIIIVTLISLVTSEHQNIRQNTLILQEGDTGSAKFSLWLRDGVDVGYFTIVKVDDEASLDEY